MEGFYRGLVQVQLKKQQEASKPKVSTKVTKETKSKKQVK